MKKSIFLIIMTMSFLLCACGDVFSSVDTEKIEADLLGEWGRWVEQDSENINKYSYVVFEDDGYVYYANVDVFTDTENHKKRDHWTGTYKIKADEIVCTFDRYNSEETDDPYVVTWKYLYEGDTLKIYRGSDVFFERGEWEDFFSDNVSRY